MNLQIFKHIWEENRTKCLRFGEKKEIKNSVAQEKSVDESK